MIQTKILEDGRIYTWSDRNMKIRQEETGIIYDDAVDSVPHTYSETDIPIEDDAEATTEDYEQTLKRLGL